MRCDGRDLPDTEQDRHGLRRPAFLHFVICSQEFGDVCRCRPELDPEAGQQDSRGVRISIKVAWFTIRNERVTADMAER